MNRRSFIGFCASILAFLGIGRLEAKPKPVFVLGFKDRNGNVQNVEFFDKVEVADGWRIARARQDDILGLARYRPNEDGVAIDWYTIVQPKVPGTMPTLADIADIRALREDDSVVGYSAIGHYGY